MINDADRPAAGPQVLRLSDRQRVLVAGLVVVGLLVAIVGLVFGLSMAVKKTVVQCADGTYFPAGTTDFRCFAHLHAGEGSGIAVVSMLLGIVVGLLGVIASAMTAGASKPDPW